MSQLNQKTWICFRDALHRLAKSSRERHPADHSSAELIVEEPSVSSVQDERSRCSNSTMELKLESNVINRTIMNLLFQKAELWSSRLPRVVVLAEIPHLCYVITT